MNANGIPQWDEVYPSADVLQNDLAGGELYAGLLGGTIVCAFALSPKCDPEYAQGNWRDPGARFCVIHRLCVHPAFQHHRIAAQTVRFIEETLRADGFETVRLDAFSLNPSAAAL
jgi:ribosomal protein S18 acetylase RimI-like enzyme